MAGFVGIRIHFAGKPLSARATRGFLARTERGKLRFILGFRELLRDHLARIERGERMNDLGSDVIPVAAE